MSLRDAPRLRGETSAAEWALRAIGLAATIAVTVYVARLARNAIHQRTKIA